MTNVTSLSENAIRRHASARRDIYAVVRRIPRGKVATYGQVASLAGLPGRARLVGYALGALAPGSGLPWHRVVNARGAISPRGSGRAGEQEQYLRLAAEGIGFSRSGRIPLDRCQWRPD